MCEVEAEVEVDPSPKMAGTIMLTILYPKYHESRKEICEVEAEVEVDPNPKMGEWRNPHHRRRLQ